MDVEAIIRRADEDIASAEAHLRAEQGRLREAEQRVEEAQKHVEELRQLREGFVQAIERYGREAPPVEATEPALADNPESNPEPHPWLTLTQADAVLAALAEIGRPATTSEIYDLLRKAGRPEDAEHIRSTVGYLSRRAKRIMHVSRGLWELPTDVAAGQAAVNGNGRVNGEGSAWEAERPIPDHKQALRENP